MMTKLRLSKAVISEIKDGNGARISDQDQIAKYITSYFEDRFKYEEADFDPTLCEVIPRSIDSADSLELEKML